MQFEFDLADQRCNPSNDRSLLDSNYSEIGQLHFTTPIGIDTNDIALLKNDLPLHLLHDTGWRGTFVTGLGSEYVVGEGGRTVRTQYRRVQVFERPKVHPMSELTIYSRDSSVTSTEFKIAIRRMDLSRSRGFDAYSESEFRFLRDGTLAWIAWPCARGEPLAPLLVPIPYVTEPRIGLTPVELWWEGNPVQLSCHQGHVITRSSRQ